MEKFLINESKNLNVSMARFANVAFSDGSLLSGFNQRAHKKQPISAPNDVLRYFLTPKESGQLCLLASIFGEKLDIFFPSQNEEMKLTPLSEVAKNFITNLGYEPIICSTEDEARSKADALIAKMKWPLYLFSSDTTGEKLYEEFYMPDEVIDFTKFKNIGVIKSALDINVDLLNLFTDKYIEMCKSENSPSKENIVDLFLDVLPELNHEEKGRYLHDRM
jgi:FlaA1/EpsC-like NDP-sugar epimerase